MLTALAGCGQSGDDETLTRADDQQSLASSLTVAVPYVTNRGRDEDAGVDVIYNGERGVAHFGRCEASFTPIDVLDELAARAPFYVPSERKKVVVVEREEPEAFRERLEKAVAADGTGTVVLFVHGYSNGFSRTCRMAAEMQRLLAGQATVLMFSWPSDGNPADYVSDQADLEWSVPLLATTMRELAQHHGPSRIQLLAHSLGSRGVIQALQRLRADGVRSPVAGELVFLAPDYDAMSFRDVLPLLTPLVGAITLYASENDTPLRVSQELNGYPRLGQAGASLTVMEGVQTIDVSSAGRYQILGHEYFYYHPRVAADLIELLTTRARAQERSGLRGRRHQSGHTFWEIDSRDPDVPGS